MPTQKTLKVKSVHWSTVTVYEFGVGIGGSAVPKHGGPAIGLATKPKHVWKTTVDAARWALCECRHTKESSESASKAKAKAKASSVACGSRACSCSCGSNDGRRARRRVRWFKPLERISMLEHAGYSEDRIYRMLMESSDIAMSRRLNVRLAVEAHKKNKKLRSL